MFSNQGNAAFEAIAEGKPIPRGNNRMWRGCGAPYLRLQYRPALCPDFKAEAALRAALAQGLADSATEGGQRVMLERLLEQMENVRQDAVQADMDRREAEAAGAPASPTLSDAIRGMLPQELLEKLTDALKRRDRPAFIKQLDLLAKLEEQLAARTFDQKVALFSEGLQGILMNEELMADGGADFVLEAISRRGPEQEPVSDPYGVKAATAEPQKSANKLFRERASGIALETHNVIQAPDWADEWESISVMGQHPGNLFGAHQAGLLAHGTVTACEGDATHIGFYDFFNRYPNAAFED